MSLLQIILIAVPIIYAITLHEVAHGWVAKQLGDNTAYEQNRLSINPLKHVDPIGTVLVPIILIIFTNFAFGWAKPVPINWNNLQKPRRDVALVALAGPTANLLMLILWGLIFKLADNMGADWWELGQFLIHMSLYGMLINTVIMLLNLMPIPPLDGSRVIASVLPSQVADKYAKVEPYGIIIVLVLMFIANRSGNFESLLSSIQNLVFSLLAM